MFSLRYAVDEPLATVLTAAAEAAYQRVAALLWALKRAEHSLGAAWLLLNAMQRQLARLAARARAEGLECPGVLSCAWLPRRSVLCMGRHICVIPRLGAARLLRHATQLPCHVILAPRA